MNGGTSTRGGQRFGTCETDHVVILLLVQRSVGILVSLLTFQMTSLLSDSLSDTLERRILECEAQLEDLRRQLAVAKAEIPTQSELRSSQNDVPSKEAASSIREEPSLLPLSGP